MSDELPGKKRRTWIPILLGVLFVLGLLAASAIAITVSWFRNNMVMSQTSEEAAMQQFDEARAHFPGQQPLLQMVEGRPQYTPERADRGPDRTPLNTLHVLAYDRDEGKVVTFSLPFWLLRMKSGPIRISAYQQGWDDNGVAFRIEDIERHGPGIVVDVTERRQGRVLVWAE
jgi:hypothetical protein